MMAKTHMLLAATVTSLVMETTNPIVLGTAAVASQLPDVDTSSSLAGRMLLPLARWLENRWPHRTITHSFLATAMLALLAWPLRWVSVTLWNAFILGYFCGWFADAFTKSGVAAFYPLSAARLVIPANPRLRLTTGSRAEFVVCGGLLLALLWSLHLNTNGGLLRGINLWLAQPEGVVALFAREGHRQQIFAQIEGRYVASATSVKAEFEIIEVEGERLLVRAANGFLYWAGQETSCPTCHLAIHRVQARVGPPIVIETKEVKWQEEELRKMIGDWWLVVGNPMVVGGRWSVAGKIASPSPALPSEPVAPDSNHLATDHRPPTTVFISGTLTLRDADDLRVPQSLQQFNPLEIVGHSDERSRVRIVRVRAATLQDLAPLQSSFGAGHLIVKIIRKGER